MRAEQLIVDTMCYTHFPLERALSGIAGAGISRVELCATVGSCNHTAPEQLGPGASNKVSRLLESYGLIAASFSAHADITTESGLIATASRLQLAADLNIPIINMPLPPPSRMSTAQHIHIADEQQHQPASTSRAGTEVDDLFCENILRLADLAEKLGVVVCLQTVGYLLSDAEQCVALINRLNHPNLRINYNPISLLFFAGGAEPTKDDMTALAPYLGHVHLIDKASTERGVFDLCPLGEGIVDWKSMLGELDRVGFTGPASIELGWKEPPGSPEVVDDAVRRAIQFVQGFFSES